MAVEDPPYLERCPLDRSLPSYNALLDLGDEDEQDRVDELSDYLAQLLDKHVKEDNLLDWWLVWRDRWPRLFNMAMDLLSIATVGAGAHGDLP
jgi:hypothetical protein